MGVLGWGAEFLTVPPKPGTVADAVYSGTTGLEKKKTMSGQRHPSPFSGSTGLWLSERISSSQNKGLREALHPSLLEVTFPWLGLQGSPTGKTRSSGVCP